MVASGILTLPLSVAVTAAAVFTIPPNTRAITIKTRSPSTPKLPQSSLSSLSSTGRDESSRPAWGRLRNNKRGRRANKQQPLRAYTMASDIKEKPLWDMSFLGNNPLAEFALQFGIEMEGMFMRVPRDIIFICIPPHFMTFKLICASPIL